MLPWIVAVVAAIAGTLLGYWLRSAAAKAESTHRDQRIQQLEDELRNVRADLAQTQTESARRAGFEALAGERLNSLTESGAQLSEAIRQLQEKTGEILSLTGENSKLATDLANERQNGDRLTHQFEALASKILDEKSTKFTAQNQTNLDQLLNPLRTQITEFRGKVEQAHQESLVGRTELSAELKQLKDLNERLSTEAHNLSVALRQDTQKQGHLGEMILLQILDKSGLLQKGVHYTHQESFEGDVESKDSGRKFRTDVKVNLPGGRHLILDSKVTLNAYSDYVNAQDEKASSDALKRLLTSFRRHSNDLADRHYHRLPSVQSPDFVVMFVLSEPAFMLAIQNDESLWIDAYQKGVLFAGPTTVLFVIRIVENLWRQEQQAKNVAKIIDRGEKLYDKFVGFIDDLVAVGAKLRDADQSYQEAFSKLSTGRENLVRQVEMLRELGLKPKKKLKERLLENAGADMGEQAEFALAANAEANSGVERTII